MREDTAHWQPAERAGRTRDMCGGRGSRDATRGRAEGSRVHKRRMTLTAQGAPKWRDAVYSCKQTISSCLSLVKLLSGRSARSEQSID